MLDTSLNFADRLLAHDHGSVRVGDRELELSRLEIDLLTHLVTSPLRVHTHGELLDALWQPSVDVGAGTVDSLVLRLRARLALGRVAGHGARRRLLLGTPDRLSRRTRSTE